MQYAPRVLRQSPDMVSGSITSTIMYPCNQVNSVQCTLPSFLTLSVASFHQSSFISILLL